MLRESPRADLLSSPSVFNMSDELNLRLEASGEEEQEQEQKEEEEDDDDGPEELTFEESKEAALRTLKEALEATKREKQQLKEKRRRRHELFQEQKKRRLLPDDVLEEIEEAPAQEEEQDGEQAGESGEEDDDDSEEETDASGKIRTLQGGYTVRMVAEQSLAASQQHAAADFVRDRLYGPGSRRTTKKYRHASYTLWQKSSDDDLSQFESCYSDVPPPASTTSSVMDDRHGDGYNIKSSCLCTTRGRSGRRRLQSL